MAKPALQGVNEASCQIEITANIEKSLVLYVQPNGDNPNVISFYEFAEVVRMHDDPISQRFTTSLYEWADIQAGRKD